MKCPVCQTVDLKMTERQGVEIDYCPNCRGVWLDRGELDKIIERAAASEGFPVAGRGQQPPAPPQAPPQQPYAQQYPAQPPQPYPPQRRYDDDDYDDDYYKRQGYPVDPYTGKPKRKSMLGDLFDIFD